MSQCMLDQRRQEDFEGHHSLHDSGCIAHSGGRWGHLGSTRYPAFNWIQWDAVSIFWILFLSDTMAYSGGASVGLRSLTQLWLATGLPFPEFKPPIIFYLRLPTIWNIWGRSHTAFPFPGQVAVEMSVLNGWSPAVGTPDPPKPMWPQNSHT